MKDYYTILNVKPDAPATVIKQSYRKLAIKYHPDRNADDALSAAVFTEIAEAYSVLSNPSARKNYNNQRYHTGISEYVKPAETIEKILDNASDLKKKIQYADPFRFNREALLYFIKQLLPADIASLSQTDIKKQQQLFELIIWFCKFLDSSQIKNLMQLIAPWITQQYALKNQLEEIIKEHIKKERWEKYKTPFALLLAILLCALIFFVTRHNN